MLDASVAVAWCIADESDTLAERVLGALRDGEAAVPSIWQAEVVNALLVAQRRVRLTAAHVQVALAGLLKLPLRVHPSDVAQMPALLSLARETGLSAYDASYLDLAATLGLPLATIDRKLAQAATTAGIELVA